MAGQKGSSACRNSVIAVQTSGDGLVFFWNEHGTDTWIREQVAADGTTFSPVSIAQVGDFVVIAAQGAAGSLDLYWQPNGGTGWTKQVVAGGGTTYSAPAITVNAGSVDLAARGPSGVVKFYSAVNGSTTWHPESLPGYDATGTPAITTNKGGVQVIGATTFGAIGDAYSFGTWEWTQLTLAGINATSPAVTINDGIENIAAMDYNGDLRFYWNSGALPYSWESVAEAPAL